MEWRCLREPVDLPAWILLPPRPSRLRVINLRTDAQAGIRYGPARISQLCPRSALQTVALQR
jgi:hypothetical protein